MVKLEGLTGGRNSRYEIFELDTEPMKRGKVKPHPPVKPMSVKEHPPHSDFALSLHAV
jgi:hypothetical protein